MSFSSYKPNPPPYNPFSTTASALSAHHDADSDDDHEGEEHKHCAEARAELIRYGFPQSHKAQIAIALDVSASMHNPNFFYTNRGATLIPKNFKFGKIQKLIDKAMSIAIELSPGPKHTVTIFPFGETAFPPITIEEHDLKHAVERVWESIGGQFSQGTNYNVVAKAIRQHYFGSNNKPTKAVPTDQPPVFCIFATDGEPLAEVDEARNQFKWSEYNGIFFKFIALKGNQEQLKKLPEELQFQTLKIICNRTKKTFVPNKHLIVLDDPDKLTIHQLFRNYRLWAEEAFSHHILENDPGIDYNIKNPDDLEEMREMNLLNAEHGHDDAASSHGHLNVKHKTRPTNRPTPSYNKESVIILGLLGAVIIPLVVTSLPFLLMIGIGFGCGVMAGVIYNAIYDCIFPTTPTGTNYPGYGSINHGDDSDSDDDDDHNPQRDLWNRLQSSSHSNSASSVPPSLVYLPNPVTQQYQPLPISSYQQLTQPTHAPPAYTSRPTY
jgi:hypothetical protein